MRAKKLTSCEFQVVSNRSKGPPARTKQVTLPVRNRFEPLCEPSNAGGSSKQTCPNPPPRKELTNNLIGDSIIKRLGGHFTGLNPMNRIPKSLPGAGLRQIVNAASKLTMDKDSSLIVCAGGNDLFLRKKRTGRTEPIMSDFKDLIGKVKEKSNRGIIVGLIPRLNITREAHSKAIGLNIRVATLCQKANVRFVDPWDSFKHKKELFAKDGVHLSTAGSTKLGNLLNSRLYKALGKPIKTGKPKKSQPTGISGTQRVAKGTSGSDPRPKADNVRVKPTPKVVASLRPTKGAQGIPPSNPQKAARGASKDASPDPPADEGATTPVALPSSGEEAASTTSGGGSSDPNNSDGGAAPPAPPSPGN